MNILLYLTILIASSFILSGCSPQKLDGKTAKEWQDEAFKVKAELAVEQSEKEKLLREKDTQNDIDFCLSQAEEKYSKNFKLNSTPIEGSQDARTWTDSGIALRVEETFKTDKEFCLKRYQK